MRISVHFLWYDFWVGLFWDQKKKILYVCPLPCFVIKMEFEKKVNAICMNCGRMWLYQIIISPPEIKEKNFIYTRCATCRSEQPQCFGKGCMRANFTSHCPQNIRTACEDLIKNRSKHPTLSFLFRKKKS